MTLPMIQESSDSDNSSSDSSRYVEESLEVTFFTGGRATTSKLGMKESMELFSREGGGVVSVNIIIM